MKMKLWIATAVDYGETCDGKARVLDICKTKEEAQAVVRNDIKHWADERAGMPIVVDFDKMSAKYDWKTLDDADGCEWNIEERDIEVDISKRVEAVINGSNAEVNVNELVNMNDEMFNLVDDLKNDISSMSAKGFLPGPKWLEEMHKRLKIVWSHNAFSVFIHYKE